MRVLCLNPALSMRAFRQMKALHERGHEISLIHLGEGESVKMVEGDFWKSRTKISFGGYPLSHFPGTLLTSRYKGIIQKELASNDYDIVHSYSSPDVLGAAAARYSKVPTVFDERDMVTAFRMDVLKNYIPEGLLRFPPIYSFGMSTVYRRISMIEREANLKSSARVYVSDHTMALARRRYSIPEENSLLFYNYAMKEDIKEPMEKLSEKDGDIHIVYIGVLSLSGYRGKVLGVLKGIADLGIHIHVFGIGSPEVLEAYREPGMKNGHYHFEGPLQKDELMSEMTRFDYGLVPFIPSGTEEEYLHTMMPLKMFDYLASGIPLMAPDTKSLRPFIERTGTGRIFKDIKDIKDLIGLPPPSFKREEYVIEEHISSIEELYRSIIP